MTYSRPELCLSPRHLACGPGGFEGRGECFAGGVDD
jgi:hypothetical protein